MDHPLCLQRSVRLGRGQSARSGLCTSGKASAAKFEHLSVSQMSEISRSAAGCLPSSTRARTEIAVPLFHHHRTVKHVAQLRIGHHGQCGPVYREPPDSTPTGYPRVPPARLLAALAVHVRAIRIVRQSQFVIRHSDAPGFFNSMTTSPDSSRG